MREKVEREWVSKGGKSAFLRSPAPPLHSYRRQPFHHHHYPAKSPIESVNLRSTQPCLYPKPNFTLQPRPSQTKTKTFTGEFRQGSQLTDRKFFPNSSSSAFKVFVSNFPEDWKTSDVFVWLSKWGKIIDVFIPDRRTKLGRRFAFVSFVEIVDGDNLVKVIDEQWIGQRKVRAARAKPLKEA
ncbi:hypothetical protein ACS0TY_004919 [Phlomoides rotata]